MIVERLAVPDVLLLKPRVFHDERGQFLETWHEQRYTGVGVPSAFVQDNVSVSRGGSLRGLHYQYPHEQGKLVSVFAGRVFDVAVDIRCGSPTFGQWVGVELSEANGHQLWIPPGFAHGFLVLSDRAVFAYKCTDYYVPECDHGIRWDDPAVGIKWPVREPLLSAKDSAAPLLSDCGPDVLPPFSADK